jgi:hypothetical protein
LLPAVLAGANLEGESLTEPGALTAPWEGGDVGKYLRSTLGGRNESKAAIIVPFCKRAVYAHKYSSLAPLNCLRRPGTCFQFLRASFIVLLDIL